MIPIKFEEANKLLLKPKSMINEQCISLHVFNNEQECISKWAMNWKERLHCLFKGFIWVRVISGKTQPPILIQAERTVFEKE